MKKLALGLALALGLTTATAHAGILIEPFLGYVVSGESDDGSETSDISGTAFGLRLGGSTLGFMYGVEYQVGGFTAESDDGTETDLDTTDIGLFVGYEFPILLRAWATYYLSHKADVGASNDFEGSGGIKFGVGYTGFPFIAINLEKIGAKYDEYGSAEVDLTVDGYMLSVSLPLP